MLGIAGVEEGVESACDRENVSVDNYQETAKTRVRRLDISRVVARPGSPVLPSSDALDAKVK